MGEIIDRIEQARLPIPGGVFTGDEKTIKTEPEDCEPWLSNVLSTMATNASIREKKPLLDGKDDEILAEACRECKP